MKRRLKKLIAIGLTAALSVGILAGCGNKEEKDGKTSLAVGIWDSNQKSNS